MVKRIFITGASSGLGAALARAYAQPGVTIGLAARRVERLNALATECEAAGARAIVLPLDVTQHHAVLGAADAFTKQVGGVDIVIANAGTFVRVDPTESSLDELRTILDVNLLGVVATIKAFLPALIKSKGRLVLTSSVASFAPLPGGVYSASKVAVRFLGEAWRPDLAAKGVQLTMLYPGFVRTEMTGQGSYPFLIEADEAAQQMKAAIDSGRDRLIFPWQWRLVVPLMSWFPGLVGMWRRRGH
ncbi:SDR family NAD(P)-dependent oxidoreductase [Candidatus Berkelbacteria bacterium]|nr:SDR family NAD(P)-dependent oxidoreductase [Candidatus Berkelbacteria bacterium]